MPHESPTPSRPSAFWPALLRTGFTIALVDFLWAVVLTALYGGSQAGLWRGVASVPFGPSALDGGMAAVLLGIAVHICVAFTWSAVFLLAYRAVQPLRHFTSRPSGIAVTSVLYGPLIWVMMSRVLVPLRTGKPAPAITTRWWIQLAGHAVFVGLPIVWTATRYVRLSETVGA